MPLPSPPACLAMPAAILLLLHLAGGASAANFTCTTPPGTTCQSAIGYRVPNATTYGALLSRFNTTTLADLLGDNNLPPTTPPTERVAAKATVRIPFRCLCAGNGVGQSDHAPVYTVQPEDGLDAIARNSFDAVVTYQEIATANKIADVNLIVVGQMLWIPLPCSCDQVGGADVMHLAHIVNGGESTSGIAATFGVTEDTLLQLNKIADPRILQKEQILDVPLPVCSSSISNTSADHDLRLPNGTYALTAQDCMQCRCSSNTFQLNCTALQGKKGCPEVPPCSGGLMLGETTGAGCGSTMCAYSGYSSSSSIISIQTTLFSNQTTTACKSNHNLQTATERRRAMRTAYVVAIVVLIFAGVLITFVTWLYFWRRSKKRAAKALQLNATSSDDIPSIDSLILDLSTLQVATDNFAEHKRLGEGGFGVVYKGDLPEGQEIAVKRLSQTSRQGIEELKTELLVVAKLNHKNLVRLVGVCLEKREKILVYEYMPNRSLDTFLFDAEKVKELDWSKRFKIINGITRGLQYLHEDSQLKIVHRDLKASNVLLDSDYNPKISDFGLAKIFGGDQSQIVTHRIAGTYGYMSPEYAMRGQYSTKSDVFSLGVLILEIITGRRNYNSEQDDLINVTWEHWMREKAIELIDKSLSNCCPIDQFLKCIHIGLLCVQQKPADRPLMSAVNFMLCSKDVHLPSPTRPTFCIQEIGTSSEPNLASNAKNASLNEVTVTELVPR